MLALIMFYNTRADKKAYRVLSCDINTMIKNYVCIYYLACQLKKVNGMPVVPGGVSKHGYKSFDRILGIGIPYFFMN